MRKPPRHSASLASMTVGKEDPKVLQDFLSFRFSLSRRTAKAMTDGRSVWVNRKCVWMARHPLKTGDLVEIPAATVRGAVRQGSSPGAARAPSAGADGAAKAPQPRQGRRHIRVLWQNDSYLVCDKPSGVLSCDDTSSAEAILRVQESIPTLEAVHRLDRDTTGCLLFAKNRAALEPAIECFKRREVRKTYRAIAAGEFTCRHLTIDSPIDSQKALSRVTLEASGDGACLLKVKIDTGRTNQIRRHLASVRHPVVGDRVFGLKRARDTRLMNVPRQMLHACDLELPDPLSRGNAIKAHSPLPSDFRAALGLFGMGRDGKAARPRR